MAVKGRVVLLLSVLAAYTALRRVRRNWQDRLAQADLIAADVGPEKVLKSLPNATIGQLAKAFAELFARGDLLRFLYQGTLTWREATVQDLFRVHALIAAGQGKARFMADANNRNPRTRLPAPTCFASVHSSEDTEASIFDVINAGGLLAFWSLGARAFWRSYRFEQWVAETRKALAPKPEYVRLENFFVEKSHQGCGLGSTLLEDILEEARQREQGVLVVVVEPRGAKFFANQGFETLAKLTYDARKEEESTNALEDPGDSSRVLHVPVWFMWKDPCL